jgi:prepilin signal peptidase PulO-like enzyme (type II secretory pathway)
MILFISIFFLILGSIIGSFLNVVILRLNTGRGLNGRSGCLSCAKKLHWHELVPIISFFALKRRCSGCKSKISWQYPLVEISTALIFLGVFLKQLPIFYYAPVLSILGLVIYLIIWSILIVIFVYDLKHTIIPNTLVYTFSGLAFVFSLISIPYDLWFKFPYVLDIFSGLIFFIPFFLLWFLSRGRWIGLGDGKLALGIGCLLGFISGLSAIVLSFWIGAIFAVFLMLLSRLNISVRGITIKSEMPFAPFLIIGTLILFFVPLDILGLALFFDINV